MTFRKLKIAIALTFFSFITVAQTTLNLETKNIVSLNGFQDNEGYLGIFVTDKSDQEFIYLVSENGKEILKYPFSPKKFLGYQSNRESITLYYIANTIGKSTNTLSYIVLPKSGESIKIKRGGVADFNIGDDKEEVITAFVDDDFYLISSKNKTSLVIRKFSGAQIIQKIEFSVDSKFLKHLLKEDNIPFIADAHPNSWSQLSSLNKIYKLNNSIILASDNFISRPFKSTYLVSLNLSTAERSQTLFDHKIAPTINHSSVIYDQKLFVAGFNNISLIFTIYNLESTTSLIRYIVNTDTKIPFKLTPVVRRNYIEKPSENVWSTNTSTENSWSDDDTKKILSKIIAGKPVIEVEAGSDSSLQIQIGSYRVKEETFSPIVNNNTAVPSPAISINLPSPGWLNYSNGSSFMITSFYGLLDSKTFYPKTGFTRRNSLSQAEETFYTRIVDQATLKAIVISDYEISFLTWTKKDRSLKIERNKIVK